MKKVIIFGTGKVAEIAYSYFKTSEKHSVIAFTVDQGFQETDAKFGLPVVPFSEINQKYAPTEHVFFVALGYQKMNRFRMDKVEAVREKGYQLTSYIDKHAFIASDVEIGDNCLILDQVSIGPYSSVASNVFIYSGAVVGHHAAILSSCWLTSGCVVGGSSRVGKNTFIGINASIGHNIAIGDANFIGAGAVVTQNTEDDEVYIASNASKHRLNSDQFTTFFQFT